MSSSGQICRQFSLDEIKSATRNFDDELIIGKGGFGSVYKGSINNGAEIVAIKRLSNESTQGETEFLREIQTLSKLQHHNLVRLEGYCNESPEKILVYEYMQNGTLVDHLYKFKDHVAIKRLSNESTQGETEFLREIQPLSKLQHHNLVRLEGYCNESPEKILVYEYMQNGTLVDHLYKFKDSGSASAIGDDQPTRLPWEKRLNICIGAAIGLEFLHRGASHGVIHRDIKGSNILLDDNFEAKIADFGLAKLVKTTSDPKITSVSTTIFKGTFGYMDPEYYYTQRLTTKTDIYAFGVVLLVVLSGRPAVDNKAEEDQRSLSGWATKCIKKNRVDLIIDPYLVGKISSRSLKQFVRVSLKCVRRQSEQRPTMEEVVAGLELALRKQPPSGLTCTLPNEQSNLRFMIMSKLQLVSKKTSLAISDEDKYALLSASVNGFLCPQFSLNEIKRASQNFSHCIGRGGFSSVYVGHFNTEETVTIKRFRSISDFLGEFELVCKLQHAHVVRLKGHCLEASEGILVYEYVAKGSLENHLYSRVDNQQARLTWEQRLNICIGAARGLDFLHRAFEPGVVHGDVKCSNIMLDDNFVAKIADLGMAKLANYGDDDIVTAVSGTMRYMTPEYLFFGRLTKKSDVYGFGVVLLVVLSGRTPSHVFPGDDGIDQMLLSSWAEKCIQENIIDKLIDPDLVRQFKCESLEKFLEVAQSCFHVQPDKRHTMEDVVAGLELALEKQLSSTSTHWVESHELPNLVYLRPQNDTMQDDEYSGDGEYLSDI